MKPLTNQLEQYDKKLKELVKIKAVILKRLEEVVKIVHECFGEKPPQWVGFSDIYSQDGMGEINISDYAPVIFYWAAYGKKYGPQELFVERENGEIVEYQCEIPLEFLSMTNAQIKKQVKKEIKFTKDLEEKEQNEKEELIKSAKKKLSKTGLEALGL